MIDIALLKRRAAVRGVGEEVKQAKVKQRVQQARARRCWQQRQCTPARAPGTSRREVALARRQDAMIKSCPESAAAVFEAKQFKHRRSPPPLALRRPAREEARLLGC